jgi:hypothetical protein
VRNLLLLLLTYVFFFFFFFFFFFIFFFFFFLTFFIYPLAGDPFFLLTFLIYPLAGDPLAGDRARSLYVTWSNSVEVTREELKAGINSKFGDIVQIVKQPQTSHALFGHVLLKVGCDVHKDVLKGSDEVLVTINGKQVRCKEDKPKKQ